MFSLRILSAHTTIRALTALLIPAAMLLAGCGGDEEPTPAPVAESPVDVATEAPPMADTEAIADVVEAVEEMEPAEAGNLHVTTNVLRYLPDGAQAAVGLPPLNTILETARPLADRIVDADVDIDEVLAEAATDVADDLGLSNVDSFPALAAELGVDANGPIAVFFDFRNSVAEAKENQAEAEAMKQAMAAMAAQKAAAAEAAGDTPPAAETDEAAQDADGDSAIALEEMPIEEAEEVDPFEYFGDPDYLIAFTVMDTAKAQAALDRLIAEEEDLREVDPEEVMVGNAKLVIREPFGYCFTGEHLLVGASVLLRDAATKIDAPAKLRYGTASCPPFAENELVALIYGNRLVPLLDDGLQFIQQSDDMGPLLESFVEMQTTMLGSEDDPLVFTISQSDELLKIASRVNLKTHPGLLEYQGPATPLRLAQLLPTDTLSFMSLRFNEVFKEKYLLEQLNSATDSGLVESGQAPIATQVIQMLGDELTLGITGVEEDFPALMLMISFAEPELTMSLITMLAPMVEDVQHNGVDIKILAVESPVPLWIAAFGDVVMASNSVESMKAIIDLHQADKTTDFLASLTPPQDPALPIRQAFYLNTDLLTDVVEPVAELQGGLRDGDEDTINKVHGLVREIRFLNEVNGNWATTGLTIHLKPASENPAEIETTDEAAVATPDAG